MGRDRVFVDEEGGLVVLARGLADLGVPEGEGLDADPLADLLKP